MKITFNPAKRNETFLERGLAFEDAAIVFAGDTLTVEDARRDYGEVRYRTIGFLAGEVVMVVWTPRGAARRVISMRMCNAKERAVYQKRFGAG